MAPWLGRSRPPARLEAWPRRRMTNLSPISQISPRASSSPSDSDPSPISAILTTGALASASVAGGDGQHRRLWGMVCPLCTPLCLRSCHAAASVRSSNGEIGMPGTPDLPSRLQGAATKGRMPQADLGLQFGWFSKMRTARKYAPRSFNNCKPIAETYQVQTGRV